MAARGGALLAADKAARAGTEAPRGMRSWAPAGAARALSERALKAAIIPAVTAESLIRALPGASAIMVGTEALAAAGAQAYMAAGAAADIPAAAAAAAHPAAVAGAAAAPFSRARSPPRGSP